MEQGDGVERHGRFTGTVTDTRLVRYRTPTYRSDEDFRDEMDFILDADCMPVHNDMEPEDSRVYGRRQWMLHSEETLGQHPSALVHIILDSHCGDDSHHVFYNMQVRVQPAQGVIPSGLRRFLSTYDFSETQLEGHEELFEEAKAERAEIDHLEVMRS